MDKCDFCLYAEGCIGPIYDEHGTCIPFAVPPEKKESYEEWIDHGFEIECPHCFFTCNDTVYLGRAVACPNCGTLLSGEKREEK